MVSEGVDSRKNHGLFVLCTLTIISVFVRSIPVIVIALAILLFQFIFQNKYDRSVVLMLISAVLGAYFSNIGIPYVGVALMLYSGFVLLPDLFQKQFLLIKPIRNTIVVLIFLLFSVLLTSGGDFAINKYTSTWLTAVQFLIAFSHILLCPNKHDGLSLSLVFLAYAAFMLCFLSDRMGGLSITDVLSFGSFRSDYNEIKSDGYVYNYQIIGLYALWGFCFYFMRNNQKLDKKGWFILICCALIVLCSQSRQSMLSFVLLIIFFMIDINGINMRSILILFAFALIVYLWYDSLDNEVADFISGQDEFEISSMRSIIRKSAINDFLKHPVFGVGYGRFYFSYGYGVNIHNIILEVLAETGLLGMMVLGILSYNSFKSVSKDSLSGELKWLTAIMIALLIRLMVSSDLREGISLFVIIFLLSSVKYSYNGYRIN